MQNYLLRYSHYKKSLLPESAHPDTNMIVVIPCYNEPDILPTLNSLADCIRPDGQVEVIVVVNAPEDAPTTILRQNQNTITQIEGWVSNNIRDWLTLYTLTENKLPKKHAGVGLARKIGMDEAVWRFQQLERPWDGIIVCLDADSRVETSYLREIEQHFRLHPKTPGCSIHFEHPLDQENQEAIINYELHLRYFINAQRRAGHPHAFQTVGSSMAVRAEVYARQGGMPKRQAGEDFYFLHKIIPLGNFTELNATMTIPSPRVSDRVPFGTGKDIANQIYQTESQDYTTYNFQSFMDLKALIRGIPNFYQSDYDRVLKELPESMISFLEQENGKGKMEEIKKHTSGLNSFTDRFFQWFNGFFVMKYCHFARDYFYQDQELESQVVLFYTTSNIPIRANGEISKKDLLIQLREIDRSGSLR